jgi:hypothetical protein
MAPPTAAKAEASGRIVSGPRYAKVQPLIVNSYKKNNAGCGGVLDLVREARGYVD